MPQTPDRSYRAQSACAGTDPNIFVLADGATSAQAKAICQTCAVRPECLSDGLSNPDNQGVWGGVLLSIRISKKRRDDYLEMALTELEVKARTRRSA